jgi:FkbM family methyltransferase
MILPRFLYRAYRAKLRDERSEISLITQHVNKGDFAVDVGANKGSFLYWLRRSVGKTGKVIAFEPQPELCKYLKRICMSLKWENVEIKQAAASDANGTSTLFVPSNQPSPAASLIEPSGNVKELHAVECETVTLDSVLGQKGKVNFIKIDVEGFEKSVFGGAASILAKWKPDLLFECECRHIGKDNVAGVTEPLLQLGYDGQFISPDGLKPISVFDPKNHQGTHWDSKEYCNNFFFSSKSR